MTKILKHVLSLVEFCFAVYLRFSKHPWQVGVSKDTCGPVVPHLRRTLRLWRQPVRCKRGSITV